MKPIKTCRISLLFAVMLSILLSCPTAAANLSAVASNIKGIVEKSTDGNVWRGIRNHEKLTVGDSVRTGAQGAVILTYDDGNVLSVLGLSLIQLQQLVRDGGTSQSSLNLKKGRLLAYSKTLQTPQSVFEVKTPYGTGAVRGTEIVVTVSEKSTLFEVISGTLEVAANGKTATLKSGFSMELLADIVELPIPVALDTAVLQNLTNDMNMQKQAGNNAASLTKSEDESSEELENLNNRLDYLNETRYCTPCGICSPY